MYTSKYLSSAAAVDMVSWNTGFWSSLKGVWCCSSQGETKRVTLCPPAGYQVCSAGGKGERLSQFCSCPSTSSHHIVLLWYMGSDFLWSLPLPLIQNILSHLLFLPAVSPLLATTYIIIFAPWMMHLNKKKKKKTPTYTTAAALLCPELQDTKQQEKNWQLWVLLAQAPLLAQSSVTVIHSTWVTGMQERWPACLRCESSNRAFGNLLMATFGLLTDTISPAGTHLGWLTAEWKQRRVIPPSYKIHSRFLSLMD